MAEQRQFDFGETEEEKATGDDPEILEFKVPEVAESAWRDLFAASEVLKREAPWKELFDDQWFGLKDPKTGQTCIGSIVGFAHQVLGVHLYLQPEGVAFWNETVASGEPDIRTLRFRNRMLEIEFVNKGRLQPEDWAIRKQLELSKPPNKGRPYAIFRSVRPYCFPWFPEEDEVRLLTLGAYAAMAHYRTFDFEASDDDPDTGENDLPIIPTFALEEGGDPANEASWMRSEEEMPLAEPVDYGEVDEATRERLKEFEINGEAVWQAGVVDFPEPMGEWERPFFARTSLTVDRETGMILGYGIHKPDEPVVSQYAGMLVKAGEKKAFLPGAIEVNTPEALEVLRPLAGEFGFALKRRLRLDAWAAAERSLLRL